MKPFEEMTNHEINIAVANIALNGGWHMSPKHPENKTGLWLYGASGHNPVDLPDYCNDPAFSWPLMQECYIETAYDGITWSARSYFNDIYAWYDDWKNHAENPLRLAMIVYLMIKTGAK